VSVVIGLVLLNAVAEELPAYQQGKASFGVFGPATAQQDEAA
jgi:hypothetical protein